MLKSLKREIAYLRDVVRVLRYVKGVDPKSANLVTDDIEQSCDKYSGNLAFMEDDRRRTYAQFDAYANQVAHWALANGCVRGDTVGIFVRNRLEYVALWYGLSKVGVIPALINFQLQAKALAHCISISDSKLLLVDTDMAEQWAATKDSLTVNVEAFAAFGPVKGLPDFDADVESQDASRPDRSHREGLTGSDQVMKMFTSGTTGLPKAAKVTHVRAQNYMRGFSAGAKCGPKDRMMMVLPMYHATGGLCGVGCALMKGGAVIVRPKFSASQFWDEAVKYDATLFMYVGELCRFLLSAPPNANETKHKIRYIIGNGLREEVWRGFVARFKIPAVLEFYGATEGNVSLLNINGRVGAIGRVPNYLKRRFNIEIVAHDVESGTIPRRSDGFCIVAGAGEVGELLGEIRADDARFRYDGYEDDRATQKKILRNVVTKDDAWFRTGDLVKRDAQGYIYFIDRVGDTYRWKAENVATGEVASVLSQVPHIVQANVYGVKVPGADGRAGMASIVTSGDLDLAALHDHVTQALPHYARPVFLRIGSETDTTGTFKFKKTNLVKDGFDPGRTEDSLYVANPITGRYEPIDIAVFDTIMTGGMRL